MIYLDNNATTRIAPEVRAAMEPYLDEWYANPSSPYSFARGVSAAVERARAQVAALVCCDPGDLFFTSGGSEGNNTALHGATLRNPERHHVVVSAVEHASVLAFTEYLERRGYRITRVPVDGAGRLDEVAYKAALTSGTAIASVMWANNETGVVYPVERLAALAREKGILFHCDAVQAAGKLSLNLSNSNIDLATISGHKFHGPKGIGAVYVRSGLRLDPFILGGDQENGRRAGTENVPGIVGLGAAAETALQRFDAMPSAVAEMRNRFECAVCERVAGIRVMGASVERLPNTSLLVFEGLESEALLALLDMDQICCSSGSACLSGASEPSHVLRAMGLSVQEALGAVRISLSRYSEPADADRCVESLTSAVRKLRTIHIAGGAA